SPGELGADVVVGEGQPFGTPLSFGGPYLGLFACRRQHVRRLPGRLVGETLDAEGRRAYVSTLRTREQDIRREKASSNVCTNQTLIAVCCAIQLAWLGTAGLRQLALRCARGARYAREALAAIDGVGPATTAPTFREFALRTPVASETVVERMAEEGFLAGIPLGDEYGGGLLVAVTERRTRAEIDAFAAAFEKVVR
ncbi:MAG: glycine dehydrogenase, partial [Acidimicrobiales bacterium]